MKKILLTLSIAIASYSLSFAQWTNGMDIHNTTNGYVGIGTTNPESGFKLDVNGLGAIGTQGSARVYMGTVDATHAMIQSRDNSINQNLEFYASSYNFNVGNVGIGTTAPDVNFQIGNGTATNVAKIYGNPAAQLQLNANGGTNWGLTSYSNGNLYLANLSTADNKITIVPSGHVGIGTTSPSSKLHVGSTNAGAETYPIMLENAGVSGTTVSSLAFAGNGGAIKASIASAVYGDGYMVFRTNDNSEKMRITAGGNILIGKTSQTNTVYKLDINGSARANEVVVNTTGADFVFEPDYKLPKLSEVKTYIDQNHHLPQIPSAKEMQTNGMNVGELNTRLLQKVEELTLYLIEQKEAAEKQNKAQQEQINQLKEQLVSLSKIITKN